MNLVIVESPTKAKTISKFLGREYKVDSSFGHLRDLPAKKLGVDVDKNFEPEYVVPRKNNKIVKTLKEAAKKADLIYFATDEDREGEAISWHLAQILKTPPEKMKRIAFHEITESAIKEALENPREIDMNLVDAQQARRILDRLVGYKLSPFLWKKIAKGLSAGRVQSVAVRLIVEREREIEKFVQQEYWSLDGIFSNQDKTQVTATLQKIDNKKLDKLELNKKEEVDKIISEIKNDKFYIAKITKKENKKSPYAPFITSTLQQEANRRLHFSAKQTMMVAQQLYENGLITYMRTDSTILSTKFLDEAKNFITKQYGEKYFEATKFKTKSKNAQEAHEAIRPTSAFNVPDESNSLNPQQLKLYRLIWQRAVASQMANAIIAATSIDINNKSDKYLFRANGSIIKFDGFLKVYPAQVKEEVIPEFKENEDIDLQELKPEQHFTEPPARYSDASLVKIMEEYGIGRPSTYAPTISTVVNRGYVEKIENRRLKPTETGILVNDLLVEHFSKTMDYKFTAKMEDNLDDIAKGETKWQPVIKEFYDPFSKNLQEKYDEVKKDDIIEPEKTDEVCDKCGKPMAVKFSRFGKFLACTGFPDCRFTQSLDEETPKKGDAKETDEKCDKCGAGMVVKRGRYGEFLGCSNYPDCKNMKPIIKSTGVKCPECDKGEIAERKSKRGRVFYSCDQYPACKFSLWQKPTGGKCPDCGSLLVFAKNDTTKCSKKECGFEGVVEG